MLLRSGAVTVPATVEAGAVVGRGKERIWCSTGFSESPVDLGTFGMDSFLPEPESDGDTLSELNRLSTRVK